MLVVVVEVPAEYAPPLQARTEVQATDIRAVTASVSTYHRAGYFGRLMLAQDLF